MIRVAVLILAGVACVARAQASAEADRNFMPNAGVEEVDERGWPRGWVKYGEGSCAIDRTTAHSGARSLRMEIRSGDKAGKSRCAGVHREIAFPDPTAEPLDIGVYVKGEGVSCGRDCELCYSITYAGDKKETWSFDFSEKIPMGTFDWQLVRRTLRPTRPVAKIDVYVFLRVGIGILWADDFFVRRGESGPVPFSVRRVTARPQAEGERLAVRLADEDTEWTSEAGGIVASGRGRGRIDVPVPRAATKVRLTLKAHGLAREHAFDLAASTLPEPKAGSAVEVWTSDALERVTPLTEPPAGAARSLALSVARAGVVSGQIHLSAARDGARKGVTLELGALRTDDGRTLDGTFRWERVGYLVRQAMATSHPLAPNAEERFLPDPLLPAAPMDLRAGATQSAWLTVGAARSASPGTYRGDVRVIGLAEKPVTVPVSVTVLPFEQPKTFGQSMAIATTVQTIRNAYPHTWRARLKEAHEIMLEHRLNADDISYWETPDYAEFRTAIERGQSQYCILGLLWPKKPLGRGARGYRWPTAAETVDPAFFRSVCDRLDPFVARARADGLVNRAYVYGFDELNQEDYAAIDTFWQKFRARYPDLRVMTTTRMYKDMAQSKERLAFPHALSTDIYCPITSAWDDALTAELRRRGRQVWWYTCCGPLHPFANFASIEEPWTEAHILAWQQYLKGADGFLFWSTTWWNPTVKATPADVFQPERLLESDLFVQGDGVLVYPGPDAVYPSIRLASIRDGVQDFEWLQLAERRYGRAACARIAGRFIRSLEDFDSSPRALRAAREELCALLLSKAGKGNALAPLRKDPYVRTDLPDGYFDLIPQEAIEMREIRSGTKHNAAWDYLLTRDGRRAYLPLCGELSNPLCAELWSYDTTTLESRRLFGVDEIFRVSAREIRPSKIHTSLTELADGRILMTTHTTARSPRHPFWLFDNYYEHLWEGYAGSNVLIYDPRDGRVANLGKPVARDSIYGVAYDAKHGAIFFTTFLKGGLYRMDLKTLEVKDLGQITELGSYCLFPDGRGGIVTSSRSGHVFRIDTDTLEIRDLGVVAAEPEPLIGWDIHRVIAHHAVAPDGAVWFSLHMSNKYYRLDPETFALTCVDLTPRDPKWREAPEALQKGHVFDSKGMMWYFESRESRNSMPGGALHLFRCDVRRGGPVEYMGLVGIPEHAAAMVSEVAIDRERDILHFPDGNHAEDPVWYGRIDLRKVAELKNAPRVRCRDPFVHAPFGRVAGDGDYWRFKKYCDDHAAFVAGVGSSAVRARQSVGARLWEKLPFNEDHTVRSVRFLADGRVVFRAGEKGIWRFTLRADGTLSEPELTPGSPPEGVQRPAGLESVELPGRAGRRFLAKPTAWGRMSDGRWLIGTADATFALWNPTDGSVFALGAIGAQGPVAAIGVSGDGRVAYAVCGDEEDLGHIVRYSAERGLEDLGRAFVKNRGEVVYSNSRLTCVAVNADGTRLALGSAGRLACGYLYAF